jgi:curli biogenesis system outer membrane secretion channel CsgG
MEPNAAGLYADPIGSAPVVDNATPYTSTLECLSEHLGDRTLPRVAVGSISDYTGKYSELQGGRRITQGASLMAMSAIDKAGLPLVERLDTSIFTDELQLANNNLIGDRGSVRQINPASIVGSDLVLLGGITELNFNIGSVALDQSIGSAAYGTQLYVMNVAIDLRLVDTNSLEVVDLVSYQKQIIGRETQAGIFEFFDDQLFDLTLSDRALEPMQMAVRAMIERAVGEMTRNLIQIDPSVCVSRLEETVT